METGNYRYRIINTGHGSNKYGNCEVCNKPAETVFIQQERKEFQLQEGPRAGSKIWPYSGDKFGHKACLESIRKPGAAIWEGRETDDPATKF